MSAFKSVFPRRNTFLAVIHVEDIAQVLGNARIAFDEGADGILLANHKTRYTHALSCYAALRDIFPTEWLGVNFLDLDAYEGLHHMQPSMNGMWVDNAGVYDAQDETEGQAGWLAIQRYHWKNRWRASFLYFGGVAFKYQHKVADPAIAAKAAMPYVDVITTSGEGTGIAADVEKIRSMKEAIGDHPLAVASGYTPKNAHLYNPYVQVAIVGTYLCEPGTEMYTKERVRAMRSAIPM